MGPSILHKGVTTKNRSEGYNYRLGNKKKICRHPNLFQFVETVIMELKDSSNEAAVVDGGKSNFKRKNKVVRSIAMRKRLMSELELNYTSLISYQQAIGGSLSRSDRASAAEAELEDVEPLNCPQRSLNIQVPCLEEIKVPLALRPSVHPAPTPPSISEPVQVSQKRKSDVSYSVGGANLKAFQNSNLGQQGGSRPCL